MAPQGPITTCEWMFGDAATGLLGFHALAKFNPLRWSGSQSFETAIKQLEEVIRENCRPIMIKAPANVGDTVCLETVQQAINFLKRCVEIHDFEKARVEAERAKRTKVAIRNTVSEPNTVCGTHTEYELFVSDGARQWTVQRRYREFSDLDLQLKTVPGYQCPALPPKGMFGFRHKFNIGSFNQDRKECLEKYLEELVSEVSSLADVPVLGTFLGVPSESQAAIKTHVPKNVLNEIDPLIKYGLPKPVFMLPKRDIEADNGIVEVAFGEAEDVNGVEVTVIFKDEDRPSHVEDLIYDVIRKPLFGRSADIETFTFVRGACGKEFVSIMFKGTYSGDQNWSCKAPSHMTETVDIKDFVHEASSGGCHSCRTLLWVNVWNHLFGAKNNNLDMELMRVDDYPCTQGTREEVDRRYHGMITTVA